MKKVAVIWSSPNTDGLTASAKDQFLNGLKEAGADIEEIHLNRANIVMWSYESIPCNNDTTYFGVLCPSKIVDSDSINFYEGGCCKGYGDYFE